MNLSAAAYQFPQVRRAGIPMLCRQHPLAALHAEKSRPMSESPFLTTYASWITDLKLQIARARQRAALSLNTALIELYWQIGKSMVEKEKTAGWGSGFIGRMSRDLTSAFPDMKGFSRRNLYVIRQWFLFYSVRFAIVPQAGAQIPWTHNRLILNKIKDIDEALWYASAAATHGWGRDTLELKIERDEYRRTGKSVTNFGQTLAASQSELAQVALKDPYNFDFLGLGDEAQEREIETALTGRITDFLLELGKGFAFVGRQYKLAIQGTEYFLDMLFYHLELRCYVVVELKAGKFKPEHAGKLNFYPTPPSAFCFVRRKISSKWSIPCGISAKPWASAIIT
jgi:predicted nuclease of restriction endonuclease-like (RecB) superfamily